MGLINIRRCQREWGSLKTQKLPWAVSFKADCTYQGRSKDLPSIKSPSRPSAVLLFSDLPQTKILILSVKFKLGHCANKPHDAAEISWTDSGKSLAGIKDCFLLLFRTFLKPSGISMLLSFHKVLADVRWAFLLQTVIHRVSPFVFCKGGG